MIDYYDQNFMIPICFSPPCGLKVYFLALARFDFAYFFKFKEIKGNYVSKMSSFIFNDVKLDINLC